MYTISQFSLIYPYQKNYLVYNTLTQALIEIKSELKTLLDQLPNLPKNLSEDQKKQLDILEKNGVLVSDRAAEKKKTEDWLRKRRFQMSEIQATILTTYKCNFDCPYCFEDKVKDHIYLSDELAEKIADWLIQRAEMRQAKQLKLVFYGGEPLLNPKPIEIIGKKLTAWAAENGIRYGFSMISNGSLLTPKLVDRLVPLGFRSVKITLDGDQETHDKMRPFIGGRGTFDLIMKNIEACADKVDIRLGGNINHDNVQSAYKLLDILVKKGLHKKLADIDFVPIIARLGKDDEVELTETLNFMEEGLFDHLHSVKKEAMDKGFKTRPSMLSNKCGLCTNGDEITIDALGKIYKCNLLVGHPEHAVGDISKHQFNQFHRKMVSYSAWQHDKCDQCAFLPACNGGCRYKAYVDTGDWTAPDCKHDYFNAMFPKWVVTEYEQKKAAAAARKVNQKKSLVPA